MYGNFKGINVNWALPYLQGVSLDITPLTVPLIKNGSRGKENFKNIKKYEF